MSNERKGPEGEWAPALQELNDRRKYAMQLGGSERIARQHSSNKWTARERIDQLLDDGSFRELGTLAGSSEYDPMTGQLISVVPSSVVLGTGKVDGRAVVVTADDFTIRGGSEVGVGPEKTYYSDRLATAMRMPLIQLVETAGGSVLPITETRATKIPGPPHWAWWETLAVVPVVSVAMGPCAGSGAHKVVASHFSVIVKGTGQVFAAGPAVVREANGEDVTAEQLGGSLVHARGTGVVDNEAIDELDALRQVCRFLSYLPSSVYELPPTTEVSDPIDRREEALLSIIPKSSRQPHDARALIDAVVDRGSFFEIGKYAGRSQIVGLARMAGRTVGILGTDPTRMAGVMTVRSAEKLIRFVDLCEMFHIPVVNFVDQPGIGVGTKAESEGAVRAAIRALMAVNQTTVPWCCIFVRRAYGVGGAAWGPLTPGRAIRYAWPSATWGGLPIRAGAAVAHRRELSAALDPEALLDELESRYRAFTSPFRTAALFGIEEVIDPRDTRSILCDWIEQAYRVLPEQLGVRMHSMRP